MSHQSELIETDIDAYLEQHENKELLRFLTCGSVDDGKSTLIGRLLHDSKMIYEDQLESISSDSSKYGTTGEKVDLALLVDGLQAEREQGITIDVAYRYFSTAKRKFIIADTPGHEQYTRNMATGASTCDLAVILIDARHGVMTQTRRHSYIASLLGIKHIVVAVNKMDLEGFSEEVYNHIKSDYLNFAEKLGMTDVQFVPMSALEGDNVVNRSERCDWYTGPTLMEILENAPVMAERNFEDFRFPVQYVNRPHLNFRGFCGTIVSGIVKVGDEVKVLPSGKKSKIKSIVTFDGDLQEAFVGQAVTITLEDEIDVSRGDMIVHSADKVEQTNHLKAHLVWMNEDAGEPGKEYLFKFASKLVSGHIDNLEYRVDVNTQEHKPADKLQLNDIAVSELSFSQPVVVDAYPNHRMSGSFIVIDRLTNLTVGAGMVIEGLRRTKTSHHQFSEFELELNALVRKHFPHWDAKDLSKL
ncbi:MULTISPECIES: sulfate adenylyltransferase subunit CysN [Marinimicrobium]|jgi:sulfate adenylyltransferase subunit 1|uniref:Sulfate adenylyltransferase subunit 1 n=1 Tax=Marinimicrobium koreense TaxID=306545 RepID=A0A3N1NX43_9GAMM|nr:MULTISPECIES: sulfate adenylyltransferase subunit CysN [Marinimicrobium]MAN52356.1 sulfate adenylyltransferase subunit CysN [Marinimicrobium sp.]ROQ19981.1 sulfate adenylyltransferase subunit 1 [Marinimicrobium koreense]|tara:strand:+ start:149 stop:1561 length:1413 start_codon:yes stop_codon:yes gene_type:complete